MTTQPLVSVIIPTIGRESLAIALASVARQNQDCEVIIVDDSPDSQLAFDRANVRVVKTGGNHGAAAARNMGMAHANGEYIAFLDDDDEWLGGHLTSALATLQGNSKYDIYTSRALVVDESGSGRIEPTVLLDGGSVATYLFGTGAWRSRCRRVVTPTLVFRRRLCNQAMHFQLSVNEDIWWLLSVERDMGARTFQSPHIGVVVRGATLRSDDRWSQHSEQWLDLLKALDPNAYASEQVTIVARPATRRGDWRTVRKAMTMLTGQERSARWQAILLLHLIAAVGVKATRELRSLTLGLEHAEPRVWSADSDPD